MGTIILVFAIAGPIALAFVALARTCRQSAQLAPNRGREEATSSSLLGLNSALAYALSFNVVFFIQYLALVVPKAMTPGLHPIIFHNSHRWSGDNPIAALLQGTGALTTILTGGVVLALLRVFPGRNPILRLLLI